MGVIDGVEPGDYRATLLVAGVDPQQADIVCERSNERYWLLLNKE